MARSIRVVVLNCDESCTRELRATLLANEGVKIAAEVDEPAMFLSALEQFPAELVVVNLDSDPEGLIGLAADVVGKQPELCLFAISATSDSDMILQSMRAGFREFLLWPIDEEQLGLAIGRLVKAAPNQGPSGKLVCVMGPSGGCGATTLSTNLACELVQLSRRGAAVVDLDLAFGHVATMLDITPQFTLADLCQTLDSIDPSMVEKALLKHDSGLKVLARPQHFEQAGEISAANTVNVLNLLCDMFEYVVCDGPSRYDAAGPAILDLADVGIMVVNLAVPSVRNTSRIIQELTKQGYNLNRLKIVVNRHTTDTAILDVEDLEECLAKKVDFLLPDDPKHVSAAINMGRPLPMSAPKSKIRDAIRTLADRIHNPSAEVDESAHAAGAGLLARMFNK